MVAPTHRTINAALVQRGAVYRMGIDDQETLDYTIDFSDAFPSTASAFALNGTVDYGSFTQAVAPVVDAALKTITLYINGIAAGSSSIITVKAQATQDATTMVVEVPFILTARDSSGQLTAPVAAVGYYATAADLALLRARVYSVLDYGATRMSYYEGGTATSSSTTFTHPTAAFVTGQYIYILKASNGQTANDASTQNIPLTTTYTYAGTGTSITLARASGRTLTGVARFAIGTDQTAAIQSAIDAAGTAGGGMVTLPAGFFICGPLVLRKRVWLVGAGKRSTVLIRPAGAGAEPHVRNEFTAGSGTAETAVGCGVLNLCLDGNAANQTTKAGCYGVHFRQSISFSQTNYDELFDTWHTVEHVHIQNTGDTGFYGDGASEARLNDVFVYYSQGSGFRPASDSFLNLCSAAEIQNEGFLLEKNSLRLTNCKAFFTGRRGGRTNDVTGIDQQGAGYHVSNVAQGAITISACEAQDCGGAGFHLRNSTRVTLTGCIADSCSALLTDWTPGYILESSSDNEIEACISFDRFTAGGTGSTTAWGLVGTRQKSAVSITGTSARNRVDIVHTAGTTDGVNYATMGPFVKITAGYPSTAIGGLAAPYTATILQSTSISTTTSATSIPFMFIAPCACIITYAALVTATAGIPADNTNYWSVELRRYRAGVSAVIATKTTQASGGSAVTQYVPWVFDPTTFDTGNQVLQAGDAVTVFFTKLASATTWVNAIHVIGYVPV